MLNILTKWINTNLFGDVGVKKEENPDFILILKRMESKEKVERQIEEICQQIEEVEAKGSKTSDFSRNSVRRR